MSEKKKEAFAAKMVEILNYGALNLGIGTGYKAGLFEVMADIAHPATVDQIAEKAGLHPRYVAEWLGIMATGGIVTITSDDSGKSGESDKSGEASYLLPPEHAACLTLHSGDANLGVYAQELPLLIRCALGAVEADFSKGEGVPFSAYPEFQAFMGELSDAKHEKLLVEKFVPSVDDGNVMESLQRGIQVCDLGCGEGVALTLMARHFPASTFTGIDNHAEALEAATARARRLGLENIVFINQDAARIEGVEEFKARFDYITAFDAIHDQSHPLEALKGVRYMLKDSGRFSMVDIDADSEVSRNMDHPMAPFLYAVSLMHCMPVGLGDNGMGLGMMWGRQKAAALLREAGFQNVELCRMDYDPFNLHYLCC